MDTGGDATESSIMTNQFSKKHQPPGFYVYAYLRSENTASGPKGSPYYIGKGKDDRAWVRHGTNGKYWAAPGNERIFIVRWNISEQQAFELEISLIAFFGNHWNGGLLSKNFTDGGDGSSGYKWNGTAAEIETRIQAVKDGKYAIGARKAQVQLNHWKSLDSKVRRAFLQWEKSSPGSTLADFDLYFANGRAQGLAAQRIGLSLEVYSSLSQAEKDRIKTWVYLNPSKTGAEYLELKRAGSLRMGGVSPLQRYNYASAAAEKYDIDMQLWLTLNRQQVKNVAKRFARGKRGAELLAGIAAA